jgi:hypothetical protein
VTVAVSAGAGTTTIDNIPFKTHLHTGGIFGGTPPVTGPPVP